MSPIVLVAMLLTVVLVFALPRKYAIVPVLLFAFLTPLGQQFNIGGFHFFTQRIVILCGCVRVLSKAGSIGRAVAGGVSRIDKVFLVWAIVRAFAFVLLYREGAAVVNQLGFLWDALGGYLLFRSLVRDAEDIRRVAKVFVVIAIIMAACMLYEQHYLKNVFALLMGGQVVPDIRLGKVRCRGVFGQEIIASTFGGTLVPFFLWLWTAGKARIAAAFGLMSSVIIAVTASSSTGICAAAAGIGAICLWPLRKHVRWMLWGIVAAILGLALVMNAPVWFALAYVDFAGGSTGWDRANLIDQCVRHFGSWWLVGTADNANWGFFTWDLCNQFVAEAEQGGLAALILFLVLVSRSFRRIGVARKMARDRSQEWLLWTIGCILCAHLAGFFGISYFDQIKYWWFVTLAMIPAATLAVRASVTKELKPVLVGELNYPISVLDTANVTVQERPAEVSISRRLFD